MDIFWQEVINCGFCDTRFTVGVSDVRYGDLRQPFMFMPDWQYYVQCSCGRNHVVTSLPHSVSTAVQKVFNEAQSGEKGE